MFSVTEMVTVDTCGQSQASDTIAVQLKFTCNLLAIHMEIQWQFPTWNIELFSGTTALMQSPEQSKRSLVGEHLISQAAGDHRQCLWRSWRGNWEIAGCFIYQTAKFISQNGCQ